MVTVLYATEKSIYKSMGLDVYDIKRDARSWQGGNPCIAHPPCRAWGKLKGLAKPRHDEKELALHAINMVRQNGGVLEHPASSDLFKLHLPKPGFKDEFGGWSICINQFWFGHPCEKKTLLYFCGIEPKQILPYPIKFDAITHVITTNRRKAGQKNGKKEASKRWREATPPMLAEWLYHNCLLIKNQKT